MSVGSSVAISVAIEEGRRERKKRQTRQSISDAATRLFFEHGFEAVSLAQVAEAADVSIKTIFNHFGSKEDLFFDRADELRDSIVYAIVHRPAGTTLLESLKTLLVDNWLPFDGASWDRLTPERFDGYRRFLATQEQSPALRSRRLVIEGELSAALLAVVANDIGRLAEDPMAGVLNAMVAATMQLRSREFAAAALASSGPEGVRLRVVTVVSEAFRRLAAAYPDL
jgi:AcrR family transcriptional regulator